MSKNIQNRSNNTNCSCCCLFSSSSSNNKNEKYLLGVPNQGRQIPFFFSPKPVELAAAAKSSPAFKLEMARLSC